MQYGGGENVDLHLELVVLVLKVVRGVHVVYTVVEAPVNVVADVIVAVAATLSSVTVRVVKVVVSVT